MSGSILKLDGGPAHNNLLMQMQTDLLDRPVSRPYTVKIKALGTAMKAGLALGMVRMSFLLACRRSVA